MAYSSLLQITDLNEHKLEIRYSDIIRCQGYAGVHPIKHGNSSYAGPKIEWVEITTNTGAYKSPRTPENDREILTFILSQKGDLKFP